MENEMGAFCCMYTNEDQIQNEGANADLDQCLSAEEIERQDA